MGNGTVPASGLTAVQGSIELATDAAVAYLALKAAEPSISIATPLGGYRSLAQQAALKANPRAYGSSLPSSAIASAGSSSHGLGENVDLVGPSLAQRIAWAHNYGFVQRDAKNDPNCFHYTGTYHPAAPVEHNLTSAEVMRVGAYLNARGLGRTSTAAQTGIAMTPGTSSSNYYWMVQAAGNKDGLYPTPAYKINGVPGTRTYWLEGHYRDLTAPVAAPPVVVDPPVTPPVTVPPLSGTGSIDTTPTEPTDPTPPVTTTPTDPTAPSDPITTVPPTTTGTTKPPATTPVKKPDVSTGGGFTIAGIVAAVTAFIAWLASIGH